MKKILTLCLIYREPHILLGMKKRGFGAGRWNGFGGKLKDGESIAEAAKREVREEAGINVLSLEKAGILTFYYKTTNEFFETHLFLIKDFLGKVFETEEMKPQWFHKNELPFEQMWPDDQYWMPFFLAGRKFKADFHFFDYDKILTHNIEEVAKI